MKIIICVMCIFATFAVNIKAHDDDGLATRIAAAEKCKASTGVDDQLIIKNREGQFSEVPKLSQYELCVMVTIGILDDNAKQIKGNIPKVFNKATVKEVNKFLDTCPDVPGVDKYDVAHKYYECYYKNGPYHLTFA